MCTYHSSMTLGNALDSARHQTCQNWELVILDNGSKDETITVLQEYERIDERIHVIYRDSNVGWRKGISLCLEKASGQYMMFLGADDYLASDETLQEVTDEIRKESSGYCMDRLRICSVGRWDVQDCGAENPPIPHL